MTTITLDSIKAEHSRLAEMIAAFEAQPRTRLFTLPEAEIELKDGEHYAGIIVGKEGSVSYHLILLPGEAESVNWADAKGWAAGIGGELPNRREQSLLYANLKEEFKPNWYWSCEQHASDSCYARSQTFSNGLQHCHGTDNEFRARAVRRLEIQ